MSSTDRERRSFLVAAGLGTAGLAATSLGVLKAVHAQQQKAAMTSPSSPGTTAMGPIRQIKTDTLDIGYVETGPATGRPVLLLHGYPYDIHSFVEVAPISRPKGCASSRRSCAATARPAFSTPPHRAPASRGDRRRCRRRARCAQDLGRRARRLRLGRPRSLRRRGAVA